MPHSARNVTYDRSAVARGGEARGYFSFPTPTFSVVHFEIKSRILPVSTSTRPFPLDLIFYMSSHLSSPTTPDSDVKAYFTPCSEVGTRGSNLPPWTPLAAKGGRRGKAQEQHTCIDTRFGDDHFLQKLLLDWRNLNPTIPRSRAPSRPY